MTRYKVMNDALASKSHNCTSYMQNHMCGNPNNNLQSTCANMPVKKLDWFLDLPGVRVSRKNKILEMALLFNLFHAMIFVREKIHAAPLADNLKVNFADSVGRLNKETMHCS